MTAEEKVHYLRNDDDIQTLCGRVALKVKSSTFIGRVDCKVCLNSFPVKMTGCLDDIIKTLQDNGYELDGTRPVFIKLVDGKLYIRRSRWTNWDKVEDD